MGICRVCQLREKLDTQRQEQITLLKDIIDVKSVAISNLNKYITKLERELRDKK